MRRLSLVLVLALSAALPARAVPLGAGLVTIYRDSYGVPHIVGETREAMAYGAGHVLGRDRLFETDVIRRLGQGRLSEVLGAGQLEADQVMRRDFYDPADIAAQVAALPAEIRRQLQAFADGMNTAIAEQTANPAEMSVLFPALGYLPEPWTIEDSATVIMLFTIVFFAGEGAGGELENAAMLKQLVDHHGSLDAALPYWEDLLLRNDPQAAAVVPPGEEPPDPPFVSADHPSPEQLDLALLPGIEAAAAAWRESLERVRAVVEKLPLPRIGSYGLAATGERTAYGKGLLFGSPQAGFLAPSLFYEMGLHAPGIDCTGFTVPGLGPYIGIGWCNDHAWTLVAGNAGDQVDLTIETLCGATSYVFEGACVPMTGRTEVYHVRPSAAYQGPPIVETQVIFSTVHGTVFRFDDAAGVAYVFRRAQAGRFVETFLGSHALNFGRSLADVEEGLRGITATYNLLYADTEGNIAYRFTGFQPMRAPAVDHRLPTPGGGEHDWQGMIPFEQMPHVEDPAGGILHVNQGIDSKPISWWPRASDVFVARFGHTGADQTYFAEMDGLDIDAIKAANREIVGDRDIVTPRLAGLIDEALSASTGDLGEAYALFDSWRDEGYPRVDGNGDGLLDHPGVTVFGADYLGFPRSSLWGEFMARVWAPAGRQPPGPYVGRMGQTLAAIESPELFAADYATGWQQDLRDALSATLSSLEARFEGAPMSEWLSEAPVQEWEAVGLFAPRPMKVADHGTYSQIVDLGRREGWNIQPAGNGRADRVTDLAAGTGPHFDDQLELYENWEFKPMKMWARDYSADPESVEVLAYPGVLARG